MERAGLCAVAGLLLVASPAFGQATPAPTASSYTLSWVRAEGAEACPPARALSAEVERRLGRAVFDPMAERGFEVEVTRFGANFRSDVFVRGPNGEALGHRTLQSDEPGCAALLNATALAIALVIDPEAATREPPPAKSSAAFEPPVVALPPPAVAPAAPLVAAPVVTPPAPTPPAASPRPSITGSLSLRAALEGGLVPDLAPGLELAFALRFPGRWGFATEASYTPPRNAALGAGSLDVGLTRASFLGSFLVLRGERASWSLLAGPSLGAFHVAVREPAPVTNPGDFWFSALQLGTLLQLHVTHGVFVEAGARGLTPLRRQEFLVRAQEQAVWSQPRLAGSLFLGVGASFP